MKRILVHSVFILLQNHAYIKTLGQFKNLVCQAYCQFRENVRLISITPLGIASNYKKLSLNLLQKFCIESLEIDMRRDMEEVLKLVEVMRQST